MPRSEGCRRWCTQLPSNPERETVRLVRLFCYRILMGTRFQVSSCSMLRFTFLIPISAVSSTLPQYLPSLQRHGNARMVREGARGVIAGRTSRSQVNAVGDEPLRIGRFVTCSHGYDLCVVPSGGIGIELYPEVTGRKIARPNLYLERMPPVMHFGMHGAEAHTVPPPSDLVQPPQHLSPQSAVVCGALAIAGCRGKIVLLGVVLNGPAGRKFRGQARHAFPHPAQPPGGHAVVPAIIELRDHFLLQQRVHGFGLDAVPCRIIPVLESVADRPADLGRIGLRPPAIELGEIQTAVD